MTSSSSIVNNPRQTAFWQHLGILVRGSKHEKSDKVCQDAFAVNAPTVDVLLIALADGAGSATHSDIGAKTAVNTAITSMLKAFDYSEKHGLRKAAKQILEQTNAECAAAVTAIAEIHGQPVREFSSTLLLTIATPTFVAVSQVGDGGIVAKKANGKLVALTKPEEFEYANQTCFLTSSNAVNHTKYESHGGKFPQLALFSDGLQHLCLKLPKRNPSEGFFNPLFSFARSATDQSTAETEMVRFFSSAKVREHTDDDVSLVIATLGEPI